MLGGPLKLVSPDNLAGKIAQRFVMVRSRIVRICDEAAVPVSDWSCPSESVMQLESFLS